MADHGLCIYVDVPVYVYIYNYVYIVYMYVADAIFNFFKKHVTLTAVSSCILTPYLGRYPVLSSYAPRDQLLSPNLQNFHIRLFVCSKVFCWPSDFIQKMFLNELAVALSHASEFDFQQRNVTWIRTPKTVSVGPQ